MPQDDVFGDHGLPVVLVAQVISLFKDRRRESLAWHDLSHCYVVGATATAGVPVPSGTVGSTGVE